jgi:prolyl oligopeptidase
VVEDFHGTKVADPYRWLEDLDDPLVQGWAEAQADLTEEFLRRIPARERFARRLAELVAHPTRCAPVVRGERRFETRDDGQGQTALWVADGAGDRVLVRPAESTTALGGFSVSPDGEHVVYTTTTGGGDWATARVVETGTGKLLPDAIEWLIPPMFSWLPNSSGFYYVVFGPPGDEPVMRVHLHLLGEGTDQLVYEPPPGSSMVVPRVSSDGRYLHIDVAGPGSAAVDRILLRPLDEPDTPFTELVTDEVCNDIGLIDDILYLQTHRGAPRGRVVAVDIDDPSRERWREIVPEGESALSLEEGSAYLRGGHLVTVRTELTGRSVQVTTLDGAEAYDVQLPGPCRVRSITGSPDDVGFDMVVSSWTLPNAVVHHDIPTRRTTVVDQPAPGGHVPDGYVTETVLVPAAGDVRVPVTLVRRRDVNRNRARPTLLLAYGGFGYVFGAGGFRPMYVGWIEAGGVLAVAGPRGGGEFGQDWHDAGRLERKQNTFDDCYAVARWLVEDGWTRPSRLAFNGQSNGGLLAGTMLVQHPELFGAVIAEVAVLDMMRYHLGTTTRAGLSEYGAADDPTMFPHLLAYSPVHNVRPGVAYPATLITTGEHDDRLPPGVHSYKFAAALQQAQAGPAPILLHVQRDAGHGHGKSAASQAAEGADLLAFLWDALGIGD